jgi:hypothetical protein
MASSVLTELGVTSPIGAETFADMFVLKLDRPESGTAPRHIADGDLELYALDRLAEPNATPVAEHLLVCEECRAPLAAWDDYVGPMRVVCI